MKLKWKYTTWKSKDPSCEEWQGVARLGGEVKIVTADFYGSRKEAIEEAKLRVAEFEKRQ